MYSLSAHWALAPGIILLFIILFIYCLEDFWSYIKFFSWNIKYLSHFLKNRFRLIELIMYSMYNELSHWESYYYLLSRELFLSIIEVIWKNNVQNLNNHDRCRYIIDAIALKQLDMVWKRLIYEVLKNPVIINNTSCRNLFRVLFSVVRDNIISCTRKRL